MNEELEYVLETIKFKTSIYRDKKKRNLSFNDDDYYSNILNEYITNLQQENKKYKEAIDKAIEYIENNQEEHRYTDRGGFSYTQGYFLTNSQDVLDILKEVE